MPFSVLSWNVKNLSPDEARVSRIAARIKQLNPDLFGLLEIANLSVVELMGKPLLGYDFALTDGPESQEILVGWRRDKFDQIIFTQKREFKASERLRPGSLISVKQGKKFFSVLFLHTDSGTTKADFDNRKKILTKVFSLHRAIKKSAPLLVLGDLNTMGWAEGSGKKAVVKVSEAQEIEQLKKAALKQGMRVLGKQHDQTFNDGTFVSDLDHVLATQALKFKTLGKHTDKQPYVVRVIGWNELGTGRERSRYRKDYSDHSLLFAETK